MKLSLLFSPIKSIIDFADNCLFPIISTIPPYRRTYSSMLIIIFSQSPHLLIFASDNFGGKLFYELQVVRSHNHGCTLRCYFV